MDKDEIKGKAERAKGYVKEKLGQATNDPETESEGTAERVKGTVREQWGEVKDKAKRAADEVKE
jgi:uncharacterized protein YjbJ (UPF0337 family)